MTLSPGESRTVRFLLSRTDLEFIGAHNQRLGEPGDFDLWLGQSSEGGGCMACSRYLGGSSSAPCGKSSSSACSYVGHYWLTHLSMDGTVLTL